MQSAPRVRGHIVNSDPQDTMVERDPQDLRLVHQIVQHDWNKRQVQDRMGDWERPGGMAKGRGSESVGGGRVAG